MESISERVQAARAALAAACERSGRDPREVTLVAATKTRTVEEIRQVVEAGVHNLGENYVQELRAKREALDKAAPGRVLWHVIGHVQRNKVKYLVPGTALIHSVDNGALAQEIERRAAGAGLRQAVLLEVNLAGEGSKSGVAAEEVPELARILLTLPHVDLQGLMCLPPYAEQPEASRPYFVALRGLAAELVAQGLPPGSMRHLSMGMSGDFSVAVEEGATLVRLGTVLFGPRPG